MFLSERDVLGRSVGTFLKQWLVIKPTVALVLHCKLLWMAKVTETLLENDTIG